MSVTIARAAVFEGQEFDLRYLLTDKDGNALTNGVSIGYEMKIYDVSSNMLEVFSVAPSTSLSGILFDVPITTGWDVNDTGYNFSLPIEPVNWTVPQRGGHTYRIEILVDTGALAGKVPAVAKIDVEPMRSI